MSSIETHPSGSYLDFDFPRLEDIHLEDIATALSNTCRFGGHVSHYYSVAEHAVRVSWQVRIYGGTPRMQLAALHHDSHEAYVGDIPTPLKRVLGSRLMEITNPLDGVIAYKFGFPVSEMHCSEVSVADQLMLRVEAAQLKRSRGIGEHWGHTVPVVRKDLALGWFPGRASGEFVGLHNELSRQVA